LDTNRGVYLLEGNAGRHARTDEHHQECGEDVDKWTFKKFFQTDLKLSLRPFPVQGD
jgi:hypothetical protein